MLEQIARQFSDDIWICAPSEEQSGAGHSLTLTRPVRLHKHGERRFAVSGTPTDSVMMALRTVMPDAPDIILSDHGLPGFDGFSALAIARRAVSHTVTADMAIGARRTTTTCGFGVANALHHFAACGFGCSSHHVAAWGLA